MTVVRRNPYGLTRAQLRALALIEAAGPGCITSGATAMYDGQPFINYRTAYSLHDRRLVSVEPYGEGDAEVHLS